MLQAKNIAVPDDKRSFEHGEVAVVNVDGMTVAQATFRPGWRWSTDVKPLVGTESCQVSHAGIVLSGRFHVTMDDGQELEFGPGDVHSVSPGHDAWVVGDETCVTLDITSTGTPLAGLRLRCPCGVEFRVADESQRDHLVEAAQAHAQGAHGHELARAQVVEAIEGRPGS